MKAIIKISICSVTLLVSTYANAQSFSRHRRDKEQQEQTNSTAGYIDGNGSTDTRTQYFVDNVLPTNDTAKIAQFIAAGVDINAVAGQASVVRYYQSVLMRALYRYKPATVECLLKHGADPNRRIGQKYGDGIAYSMYPLEAAADANSLEKMQLLVKYGANLNTCMSSLKEIATQKGNMEMMNYLGGKSGTDKVDRNTLAVMTKPDVMKNFSNITPALITDLISKGADPNAFGPDGRTALINVMLNNGIKNKTPIIQALIKAGANPNLGDADPEKGKGLYKFYSTTPLVYAIKNVGLDGVKALVENGADVNAGSPLSRCNDKKVSEYLILHGAR